MRKFILFIIVSLSFACCKEPNAVDPNIDTPDETDTPQTTLMYMTGTDLTYYFNQNITAIKAAVSLNSLGSGRFLIFKHDSSLTGSLVEYKYENGTCTTETLKVYDYIVSLTQSGIEEVIADIKELAPAKEYNLIVSGHATGWVPKEMQSSWTKVAKSGEFINWEAMLTSPIVTRYLGSSNDGFFDISEFKKSLDATDTHFGYILFDECFMSSIESLYTLRNNCDYIVASPCEIMGSGFPYDTVIPELFSDSGTKYDLQGACEAFYNYYCDYSYPSGCVAMTVTSELEDLAEVTRLINTKYSDVVVDTSEIQPYERLANHVFLDFEEYMLAKCTNDASLTTQFLDQMERAFPTESRLHTERFFANIGVSASSANSYDAYYTTIEYYSGVTTSAANELLSTYWNECEWAIAVN